MVCVTLDQKLQLKPCVSSPILNCTEAIGGKSKAFASQLQSCLPVEAGLEGTAAACWS